MPFYECPDCAFSLDALHANTDGSYSCPVCELARLTDERDAAIALVELTQDYLHDALAELVSDDFSRGWAAAIEAAAHVCLDLDVNENDDLISAHVAAEEIRALTPLRDETTVSDAPKAQDDVSKLISEAMKRGRP